MDIDQLPVLVALVTQDLAGALRLPIVRRRCFIWWRSRPIRCGSDPASADTSSPKRSCLARRLDPPLTIVATTNDNLPALYFHQRRGYRLTDLVPNSITVHTPGQEVARFAGIPVRDEVRLENDSPGRDLHSAVTALAVVTTGVRPGDRVSARRPDTSVAVFESKLVVGVIARLRSDVVPVQSGRIAGDRIRVNAYPRCAMAIGRRSHSHPRALAAQSPSTPVLVDALHVRRLQGLPARRYGSPEPPRRRLRGGRPGDWSGAARRLLGSPWLEGSLLRPPPLPIANVYATRFASESIYTPQMVVDGRAEFVGSDASAARKAIERALKTLHGVVKIEVQPARRIACR